MHPRIEQVVNAHKPALEDIIVPELHYMLRKDAYPEFVKSVENLQTQIALSRVGYSEASKHSDIIIDTIALHSEMLAIEMVDKDAVVHWAVARKWMPEFPNELNGEMIVEFTNAGHCIVVGKVMRTVRAVNGRAVILLLRETMNSFSLSQPHGWSYGTLWYPDHPAAPAGFICKDRKTK